jgi:hypothetical protein
VLRRLDVFRHDMHGNERLRWNRKIIRVGALCVVLGALFTFVGWPQRSAAAASCAARDEWTPMTN